MKIVPQGDRLLVELIEEKETEGLPHLKIVLPELKDSYGMPKFGRVVAVGNGHVCQRMDFRKGDIVHFSKWEDNRLKISPRTLEQLGTDFKDRTTYLFLDPRKVYGRTYAKENESASKKERAAQRTRNGRRSADSNGHAGKSKK